MMEIPKSMDTEYSQTNLSLTFCAEMLRVALECNFTIKQLKNPNHECLNKMYKSFLTRHSFESEVYEGGSLVDLTIKFSEETIKNQSESFKLMLFYILVKYFYDLCGLSPSYMDIFHPMKNKFPKLLSGMISFCRFEYQELENCGIPELIKETQEYACKCAEVMEEISKLEQQVQHTNTDNHRNLSLVEQCRKRSAVLQDKNTTIEEEVRKLRAEQECLDREEATLEAEMIELNELEANNKRQFVLYDKLIIKSPTRLKEEFGKNEARIVELKKLTKSVTAEIDNEKSSLFERFKFIENSQSIMEILEQQFLKTVLNANSKKKEIESVDEEITNLNFLHAQTESSIESLTKTFDNLNASIENYTKESQNDLVQNNDEIEQINKQIQVIQNKFQDYEAEKEMLRSKISETKMKANDFMNNGMEKIQMFQKNETFSTKITAAKMQTISSYSELSNQKVQDVLSSMKAGLEALKKYDKERRNL